jgi:hypothetical protein
MHAASTQNACELPRLSFADWRRQVLSAGQTSPRPLPCTWCTAENMYELITEAHAQISVVENQGVYKDGVALAPKYGYSGEGPSLCTFTGS